ncbi:MAG: hypothetical protein SCK29_11545 [Bacillota bacterium]|nr:hypothetical protein [Bacillota bacterium]MDW7684737.1 hypothetical protein [Bacillota bacterium]
MSMVVLLLAKPAMEKSRMLAAHTFFLAFIFALLLIGGIIPVFVRGFLTQPGPIAQAFASGLITPHIGLLSVLVGCFLGYRALRSMRPV